MGRMSETHHPATPVSTDGQAAYLPQLDGLRGLAILAVMFHHFGFHPPSWMDWGPVGPSVFFLLSGYLITHSLWKLQGRATTGAWDFSRLLLKFHARRIFRLLPLIIVLLAIGWLCGLRSYRETWMWHLTFLTNFYMVSTNEWVGSLSHFWSLSVQEQFYLLWPLVLFVPRRVFPQAMVLIVLSAAAFRLGCLLQGSSEFTRWFLLPASLDAFATGGLVAWIQSKGWSSIVRSRTWAWPLLIAATVSLIFSRYLRFLPDTNLATSIVELFECIFFAWLLLRLLESPRCLSTRLLKFRPLIFVGKISYGIFIFHTLVAVAFSFWLEEAELTQTNLSFLRAAILAAMSIAIAAASWQWFEHPLNCWVRQFDFSPAATWDAVKAWAASVRARFSAASDS